MLSSKNFLLGLFITLPVLFAGCQTTSPTPSSPPAQTTSQTPVSGNQVGISMNAFSPADLSVKVGTKVTWTNNDSYAHTVTSDDGSFDSGNLNSGKTFSYTFAKTGTFTYHCVLHPYMSAKVTVTQ